MVSLLVVFYIFVIFFSIIGVIRGWAQELLVTFSVILAFFLINVVETFIIEKYQVVFFKDELTRTFWMRTIFLMVLVFFGYQTPRISRFASVVRKDKISDSFLGFFLGGINGYLIVGTLWFYLHAAEYPSRYFFNPAELANVNIPELSAAAQAAANFVTKLPPTWLGTSPGIYIAVGLAFLFVLVVFI
jgi:uncharacterized membrane protein required for colicin V production